MLSINTNKIGNITEKLEKIIKSFETEIILFLIFIFSMSLRLRYMNPGLFETDSLGAASAIEETFKTGTLHGIFNGRYGTVIVNMITYIPYHLITGIESAEKSLILTEILFASLATVVLFLFVQKLFDDKSISLVAAVLFSVSPIFLSVTTYGNSIGTEIFFILASFYLLACFHKKNSQFYLILSSISIVFSVMVRESAMIFVPLYFLFYINPIIKYDRHFLSLNREVLKIRNLTSVLFPFLLIFGIYSYYVFYNILSKTMFAKDDGSGSIAVFMGFLSPVLNISTNDLYFDLSLLGIIFVIGGLLIFIDSFENKFSFIFLLLWSGTFFYYGNISTYSPYYLAIVSVPLFIFIAIFTSSLYKTNKLFGIIPSLILIFILFSQIQPILDYRHNFSGEKEYALWVEKEVPPNSRVIAANDNGFFNYYTKLGVLSHPIGDSEKTKTWVKETNSLLKNGTNIYIVTSGFSYDPGLIFKNVLYQNFSIEYVGSHITEDYHKATIKDNRYRSSIWKVNKILTKEEMISDNIVYKWNFTNNGDRIFLEFTNTEKTPLNDTKLEFETLADNVPYSSETVIGNISPGETKKIEIPNNHPTKIMIWIKDLKSWMILYQR